MNNEENFISIIYSNYTIISHKDNKHDLTLFFFMGIEDKRDYVTLFKNFVEILNITSKIKIKVIIPHLPEILFPNDEIMRAWYYYKDGEGNSIPIIPNLDQKVFRVLNKENDERILNLIKNEISLIGTSEKIIIVGFSMGGRYSQLLLNKLNAKIGFILLLKALPLEYSNGLAEYNMTQEEVKLNKYYLHVSREDFMVHIDKSLYFSEKTQQLGFDLTIDIDDENKHKVDANCLNYLQSLINKYYIANPKF